VLSSTFKYLSENQVQLSVKHDSTSDKSPVKEFVAEHSEVGLLTEYTGDENNDQQIQFGETWVYPFTVTSGKIEAKETTVMTLTGRSLGDNVITSSVRCSNCDNNNIYLPILVMPKPQASLKITFVEPTAPIKIGTTTILNFKVSYAEGSNDTESDGIKVVDEIGRQAVCKDGNGNNVTVTTKLQKGETWTCTIDHTPQLTDFKLSQPVKPVMWQSKATVSGNNAGADTVSYSTNVDFTPVLSVTVEPDEQSMTSKGGHLVLKVKVSHAPNSDFSPVNGLTLKPTWGVARYSEGDDGDGYLEKDEEWIYLLSDTVNTSKKVDVVVTAKTMKSDTDEVTATGSYEIVACSAYGYDDYADENTGNWTNESNDRGTYKYEDGKYKLTPARDDKNIRTAYHPGNGKRYSNYTTQVDCEWQNSNGSCGIIFDVQRDDMHTSQITSLGLGYHFTLDKNSTSPFSIQKVDVNAPTSTWFDVSNEWSWESNLPNSFDTITTIKIKCDGTGTTLFVDDIKIASGKTSCYGEIGVISSGAGRSMYYDNFEVCGQQPGGEVPVATSKSKDVVPN
jgi:hypothetical protein